MTILFILGMTIGTVLIAKGLNRYDRLNPGKPVGFARSQNDCAEGWTYNQWTNSCINNSSIVNL